MFVLGCIIIINVNICFNKLLYPINCTMIAYVFVNCDTSINSKISIECLIACMTLYDSLCVLSIYNLKIS